MINYIDNMSTMHESWKDVSKKHHDQIREIVLAVVATGSSGKRLDVCSVEKRM